MERGHLRAGEDERRWPHVTGERLMSTPPVSTTTRLSAIPNTCQWLVLPRPRRTHALHHGHQGKRGIAQTTERVPIRTRRRLCSLITSQVPREHRHISVHNLIQA